MSLPNISPSASLPTTNPAAPAGDAEMCDPSEPALGDQHITSQVSRGTLNHEAEIETETETETTAANGTLAIPAAVQVDMMKSIIEIFQLDEEPNDQTMKDEAEDEEDEEAVEVDMVDQQRRTDRLMVALDVLKKLWSARSEFMEATTEKLADGSRDPKWRIPLGNSGILNFYLEILRTQKLEHSLKIQVLRIIGNSCADTDENRARLVHSNYLLPVIMQLKDASLLPFAIPVLYNICVDYEPAQKLASQSYLTKELIELISSPRFSESLSFIGYVCKLLGMMVVQENEPDSAPDNTALVLLKIAGDKENQTDMEDFIALVSSATSYLQHEKFQKALVIQGGVDITLDVLVQSYSRFDSQPAGFPYQLDEEDAKLLTQMRSALNQVLSDVSALPEFREAVPTQSHLVGLLCRWLLSPQMQLQICACILLGNLARSDSVCEEMVQTIQVHRPLISIITDANDSQLLHAALGFLKNLALPASNKPILGEADLLDALPRLWNLDTLQQIQFSAISLARQLIINNFDNVRRIGRPLTKDASSPASSRTKVSFLIALFDRTDVDPIKMEISRLVTAICRVFNSISSQGLEDPGPEHLALMRQSFFKRHPDIGRPLAFMVTQTKWPVVRSEGWFVFALMARYPEGAECVSDVMHGMNVFQVLLELMTGKNIVEYSASPPSSRSDSHTTSPAKMNTPASASAGISPSMSPQNLGQSIDPSASTSSAIAGTPSPHAQASEMQRIDRMNALVLLTELLKNRGDQMAVMRRGMFEDLLRGGGQTVLAQTEANPGGGSPGQ